MGPQLFSKRFWNDCLGGAVGCLAVYGQKAGNVLMRILGPILFIACQIAILLILYFYFLHIFPYFAKDAGFVVRGYPVVKNGFADDECNFNRYRGLSILRWLCS